MMRVEGLSVCGVEHGIKRSEQLPLFRHSRAAASRLF